MNNGDTILGLQETDSNIRLLAAQRELYARAKTWRRLSFFFGVASPILMAISESLCMWPAWTYFIVPMVALGMDALASACSERNRDEAARVQQRFESSVYGIDLQNTYVDEEKVKHASNHYLTRHGTDELHGWFPDSISGQDPVQAIASCQHTCNAWSEKLLVPTVFLSTIPLLTCLVLAFCPWNTEPALSASITMPAAEWSIGANRLGQFVKGCETPKPGDRTAGQ